MEISDLRLRQISDVHELPHNFRPKCEGENKKQIILFFGAYEASQFSDLEGKRKTNYSFDANVPHKRERERITVSTLMCP